MSITAVSIAVPAALVSTVIESRLDVFTKSVRAGLAAVKPLTDEQSAEWDREAERERDGYQPDREQYQLEHDSKMLAEVAPSSCVICGQTRLKKDISAATQLCDGGVTAVDGRDPWLNALYYCDWNGYTLPGMITVGPICLDGDCLKTAGDIVVRAQAERKWAVKPCVVEPEVVESAVEMPVLQNNRKNRQAIRKAARNPATATRLCPTAAIKNTYKHKRFLPLRRRR